MARSASKIVPGVAMMAFASAASSGWYDYGVDATAFIGSQCAAGGGSKLVSGFVPNDGSCASANVSFFDVVIELSFAGSCSSDGSTIYNAKYCLGSRNCTGRMCASYAELPSGACSTIGIDISSASFTCKAGATTAQYDAVVAIICAGAVCLTAVVLWLARARCAPLRTFLTCVDRASSSLCIENARRQSLDPSSLSSPVAPLLQPDKDDAAIQ